MASLSLSGCGNWSEKRFQFSSPTWSLNPCKICKANASSTSNIRRRTGSTDGTDAKWRTNVLHTTYKVKERDTFWTKSLHVKQNVGTQNRVQFSHLVEHFLQVGFGVDPGRNGITEEDEILNNSCWVHSDHVTHPAERRVFLLVVANISK